MNTDTLRADFEKGFRPFTEGGDIENLLSFTADDGLFIAEDLPLPLDKEQLRDHLSFHSSGIWERMYTTWRDLSIEVFADTGLISANFQLRGKPVSAGYRQRDGMISLVCHFDADQGRWVMLKGHMGTILGAIHHSSPG